MLKPDLAVQKSQEAKLKDTPEYDSKATTLTPEEDQALVWATTPANENAFLVATAKILSAIQDHRGLQHLNRFTKALCEAPVGPKRKAAFHTQHCFVENHLNGRWRDLREAAVLSAEQQTLLFDLAAGEVPPLRPENYRRLTSEEQWALTLVWIIRQAERAYDQLNGADNDVILDFLMHIYQLLREVSHPLLLEWKKLPHYSEHREPGE